MSKELKEMLEREYQRGIITGVRLMEKRILLACEKGNPINIEGRAYFIKSDIQNLKDIFEDLEGEE